MNIGGPAAASKVLRFSDSKCSTDVHVAHAKGSLSFIPVDTPTPYTCVSNARQRRRTSPQRRRRRKRCNHHRLRREAQSVHKHASSLLPANTIRMTPTTLTTACPTSYGLAWFVSSHFPHKPRPSSTPANDESDTDETDGKCIKHIYL